MNRPLPFFYTIPFLFLAACGNTTEPDEAQIATPISYSKAETSRTEDKLVAGERLSRPIRGGQTYVFDLDLIADQYIHVEAVQKGIDFKLTLQLPQRDSTIIFDTPNGQEGIEDLYYITDQAGTYTLEVTPFSDYAEPAEFTILLKTVRQASEADRAWMVLYDRMRAVDQLRKKKETLSEARAGFEELIPQWQQIGDTYQEAVARRSLGYTLRSMGEQAAAMTTFKEVLPLWHQLDEKRYEAFTYLIIAAMHKSNEVYDTAIDLTFKAIEKWKESGDVVQETRAYSDLGSYYMLMGDHEAAKKYYDLSIQSANESGSRSVLGIMLREYGNAWQTFGDDEKVMEYYTKALQLYEDMNHLPALGLVRRMIGDFLYDKGREEASKVHFEHALAIYETLENERMITSMQEKLATIRESS